MELRVAEAEDAPVGCVDPVPAHPATGQVAGQAHPAGQVAQRRGTVVVRDDLLVRPVALAVVLADGVAVEHQLQRVVRNIENLAAEARLAIELGVGLPALNLEQES